MELLEMKSIDKAFFGVSVLNQVSISIERKQVLALLGENGAGKSTLMNVLAGVHKMDSGTVLFDGKVLVSSSVKEAEAAGIAFVHQELNIINDLKVYENVFLGREVTTRFGRLKNKEMIAETKKLFSRLGVDIDPTVKAGELDTSKKQMLEIGKALHTDAKLIILDEPTTALNNEEIKKLFEMIQRLKNEGRAFIFISHKMPEIFEIADTYAVLRNGSLINSGYIKDINPEEVTKYMVGNSLSINETYEERKLGETILELKNLKGKGFDSINFTIRRGEIVGFTGLQGAGCSEVLQSIFGVQNIESGKLFIHGKELAKHSVHDAMKNKVAMLPANRKENSIIQDMNLLENTYISEHAINGLKQHINKKLEIKKYNHYKEKLNIKAGSYTQYITSLSGGNQQKVIIARWLNTDADVLLLDNPTQGIDVGAKDEIYKLIMELSKEGKTIIINTLEIPEIQRIADRCVVFYHGNIVTELSRNEIKEETVMLYATNAVYKQTSKMEG